MPEVTKKNKEKKEYVIIDSEEFKAGSDIITKSEAKKYISTIQREIERGHGEEFDAIKDKEIRILKVQEEINLKIVSKIEYEL
jgi:hypothetical protein